MIEPLSEWLQRDQPLAIYLEGELGGDSAKMGSGLLRYSENPIACVIDSTHAGKKVSQVTSASRDCPVVASVSEAKKLGAQVVVLGIAPPGGRIPERWLVDLDQAVEQGLCLMNGLHDELAPRYAHLQPGQWVWDIRREPEGLKPGTGEARHLENIRVLMVGTDMAVGKMTAGLELHRLARARGIDSRFVATGQIGIAICGAGIPLDAIRVDYASGAVEREVLRNSDAAMVVVEGQGALGHPGSTSTLPLMRGSMPTHLILCHRARQMSLRRMPDVNIPPLADYIKLYESLGTAAGTFPRPTTVGIALNTAHLDTPKAARDVADEIEKETGLPCDDPVRHGASRLLEGLNAPTK